MVTCNDRPSRPLSHTPNEDSILSLWPPGHKCPSPVIDRMNGRRRRRNSFGSASGTAPQNFFGASGDGSREIAVRTPRSGLCGAMRYNEKELQALSRQPAELAAELGMRSPKKGSGEWDRGCGPETRRAGVAGRGGMGGPGARESPPCVHSGETAAGEAGSQFPFLLPDRRGRGREAGRRAPG